jgi:hypothetical protein
MGFCDRNGQKILGFLGRRLVFERKKRIWGVESGHVVK